MNPTLIATLTALREELIALSPAMIHDEELLLDSLDGESNAIDTIRTIIRAAIDAEGFADAVDDRMKQLAERKARFEARAIACRSAAQQCMDTLGVTKVPAEDFTATLSAGRPKVIVTDETLLPETLMKFTARPKLSEIGAALKAGETIPGATLSNPGLQLTIRKA